MAQMAQLVRSLLLAWLAIGLLIALAGCGGDPEGSPDANATPDADARHEALSITASPLQVGRGLTSELRATVTTPEGDADVTKYVTWVRDPESLGRIVGPTGLGKPATLAAVGNEVLRLHATLGDLTSNTIEIVVLEGPPPPPAER